MPYIGKGANGFGIRERYRYSASGSQTAFTGSDLDSKTLQIDSGSLIDVYLNGVLLDTADYNTNTANQVTLTSGATASDEVMIIVYDVFSLSDAMPKTGGALSGTITNFTSTGIDDNADANAITIDSSENITIGTAGTGASSTSPKYLSLGSAFSSVAGDHPKLKLYEASDGNEIGIGISSNQMDFQGTSTDFDYVFYGNGNKLMHVNGTGEITKPNQPAFCADGTGTSPGNRTISSHGNQVVIPFPTERFDIGNNYNNSTYIFTAPIAGRYLFGFHLGYLRLQANQTIYPEFMVNGSSKGYYYFVDRSNAGTGTETAFSASGSQLINLSASDTVNLRISGTPNSATVHYYLGENEATFWGYLVG